MCRHPPAKKTVEGTDTQIPEKNREQLFQQISNSVGWFCRYECISINFCGYSFGYAMGVAGWEVIG